VEISERFRGVQLGSASSPHVTQQLLHVSMPSAITAELLRRGWTEADVRKVLGGNALRALRDAEELAEV
jgi:membrane dipeptidase